MAIERELSKILAMPDEEFIRWRENARAFLAEHGDDIEMSALYEASGQEIVNRAEQAWSVVRYRTALR